MDKHPAIFMGQRLVNEICGPFKVSTEVELLRIIGLDAQVGDARILVEASTGVDVHEGPALGSIQDVGDAQFLQLGDVLSHRRVAHVDPRDDLVAGLARQAVAAAAIREQVVEILHREFERAGHGGGGALHSPGYQD